MSEETNRLSSSLKCVDVVQALYPYACTDQSPGLVFPVGAVLLVAERADDGWCRGYSAGSQGWFPTSYVQPIPLEQLLKNSVDPAMLVSILRSPNWTVYSTKESKLYFVNNTTKETTWIMPSLSPPTSSSSLLAVPSEESYSFANGVAKKRLNKEKLRKPKYQVVNGLTYIVEGGEPQDLMNPQAPSYIDYFWSDKGEQTGFDVIREKHINGKFVMKDMIEFFRERAAIEEQYARNLAKLSKSTLGDQEEGTLLKAWLSLKTELRYRSEAHSKFASKINEQIEKQLFEFKESQKTDRKEHEHILEKARKQVQNLNTAIEKAKLSLSGVKTKDKNILKRQSSIVTDVKSGEDMVKLELNYNQAQRTWMDSMTAACRDFERHEEERSDFIKSLLLKYIDLCVGVQEANAESLTFSTNMVDNINKKADKEYFIKTRGTGTLRPVDRLVEL